MPRKDAQILPGHRVASHLEGWARARHAAFVPAAVFPPQGTSLAYQPVPLGRGQVLSVHRGHDGGLQAAHR